MDLGGVEKNEESVNSESGEEDEALQGSGKVGAGDGDVPLQDRVLGGAMDDRDSKLVREALTRALSSVEDNAGYDELSAEDLFTLTKNELGRYENRARRLRLLINQAIEEHFACAGSDRVVLVDGNDVCIGNGELRALVRATLRRFDLRKPCTVRQCREAVAYSCGVSSELSSLMGLEFSGLVMQEWTSLWEVAWRSFVSLGKDTDEACCRARVRTRRAAGCVVLEQCPESVQAGTFRCARHAVDAWFGIWDPKDGLIGIPEARRERWVIAEAKHRAVDDRRPLTDGGGGFNLPRQRSRGAGGTAGSRAAFSGSDSRVLQRTIAPEFVPHVPGELRVFSADPEALPPFPCLLCRDADFGSKAALLRHISEEHVSWPEYRKRILYEAGRGRRPVLSQVWRLVMGHATEELCTGSKEWCGDVVDGLDSIDVQVNLFHHMNQLVRRKGGLVKFFQSLVRSLEVGGVDLSASDADAVAAVCAEDVCVEACFAFGKKTSYMQAIQLAVLHVARQIKASSCAIVESNVLKEVSDTLGLFLEDKGLSLEDHPADCSQRQMDEADSVCEESGGSYWSFAAWHVVRRAAVLRHLFRPVSDCGGLRSFIRELRRDMYLLESTDERGVLKEAVPSRWIRALVDSASLQTGHRETPSRSGDSACASLEGVMDDHGLDEDSILSGSLPASFPAVAESGERISPTNLVVTQTEDKGPMCLDVVVSSSPPDEDGAGSCLAVADMSPPESSCDSPSPGPFPGGSPAHFLSELDSSSSEGPLPARSREVIFTSKDVFGCSSSPVVGLSEERHAFYRRWFADVVSRPSERAVVLAVTKLAMCARELSASVFEKKSDEDFLTELGGVVGTDEPSDGELWDWASYGTAAQVASFVHVHPDALGAPETGRREKCRHTKECCVCARRKWSGDVEDVYFFEPPEYSSEKALFERETVDEKRQTVGVPPDTRRNEAHRLFSPYSYFRRWSFSLPGGEGLGGIPLRELQASCVRDPVTQELWLLHKKAFKLLADGCTVDKTQKVPICADCKVPLTRMQPSLPKYALSNDLWMGRVPVAHRGLTEGASLTDATTASRHCTHSFM